MRGGYHGSLFDKPCADNISFSMIANLNEGTYTLEQYKREYPPTENSSIDEIATSIPMHAPIFPRVSTSVSEEITFSLTPSGSSEIKGATLCVQRKEIRAQEVSDRPETLVGIVDVGDSPLIEVIWSKISPGIYRRETPGGIFDDVFDITFSTVFKDFTNERVTYVTYVFDVTYEDDSSDRSEITFALQNFHQNPLLENLPAPVYAQGDRLYIIDVLFIPARDHCKTEPLKPEFISQLNAGYHPLIKDVFFGEPHLRLWRKQFNFWVNKQEGMARDYERCRGDCYHQLPDNLENFELGDFELKALLHESVQRDYTDPNEIFSAQVNARPPNVFLHELGHSYLALWDEYRGGAHQEETEKNFPNNWASKSDAENDAPDRHKVADDARGMN